MNKYLLASITIIALWATSCSSHSDEMADYMSWSCNNQSPDNIKFDYNLDEISKLYIEVNDKGGDITLICNNYDKLEPLGWDGSDTYNCDWGVFTIEGQQVNCHFPQYTSAKEASAIITISPKNGKNAVKTILYVKRTFGDLVPDPGPGTEEVADKYKFQLVQSYFTPFMNDNFSVPAIFDNISYQINDYLDRYHGSGCPEFTQHYDSIVWCADGLPNTVRIYERQNTANSTEEHFTSHWSTHFFKGNQIKNYLKGYRDGKVVYSTSLTTNLHKRDFLCYDWINGSIAIANPGHTRVYCMLDSIYEYNAEDVQEMNGTRYAQIYVNPKSTVSNENSPAYMQKGLSRLMSDNAGQPQSIAGKVDSFKCLPTEGVEAIKFWENTTTRILLLHKLPDDDSPEKYYLHIEPK